MKDAISLVNIAIGFCNATNEMGFLIVMKEAQV
jgi:hypothetical protein